MISMDASPSSRRHVLHMDSCRIVMNVHAAPPAFQTSLPILSGSNGRTSTFGFLRKARQLTSPPRCKTTPPSPSPVSNAGPTTAQGNPSTTVTKPGPIHPLSSPPSRFYDFSQSVVSAIRVTHCRLLSEQMAKHVEATVRSKTHTLSHLAAQLSTCAQTRATSGDTGWHHFLPPHSLPSSSVPSPSLTIHPSFEQPTPHPNPENETTPSDPPPINNELLPALLRARPGALTVTRTPYGWEVFTVTDIRHTLSPTTIGARRLPGVPPSPRRMRRRPAKKPTITPKSYFIHTLGCQMNESDSERMAASLDAAGYSPTTDVNRAAVYVLNTCALRESAQEKVYSYLGPQAARKWGAPQDITLVVAGCVAQQEGDGILSRVPEVDVVLGPQYANRIAEVLAEYEDRSAQIVAVDPAHISEDVSKPRRGGGVTAWVNVIYGCNERCSYCVVPNTRGLEQSRSMEAVRAEVVQAVADGFREVVLLGQNVDAYGRDLFPKRTLADLLKFVHDVPGLKRIRFTTGHPRYISDALIATVRDLPKVMEHFHIPPQSGDSSVLKEMRRGYTRERYLEIVRRIRAQLPDASICADMIVGFPGETVEAFERSVSLADEVVFDANMVRAYSARPNTRAALRGDQVEEEEKKRRLDVMNVKMKENALERSQRFLGRVVEVLVEGCNMKVEGEMMGRERSNRVVFFRGGKELVGEIVHVHVDEAFTFSLRGRVVQTPQSHSVVVTSE